MVSHLVYYEYGNNPYKVIRMTTETYERFDIRMPSTAKQMLTSAAEINGTTLTALVMGAAMDKAREIMNTHKTFMLNNDEWNELMKVLEQPTEPNEALQRAAKNYRDSGMK